MLDNRIIRTFVVLRVCLIMVLAGGSALFALLANVALAESPNDGFNPGANDPVHALAVQADGKILVGGKFTTLGVVSRNYIARLNADGSLDTTFNPDADSPILALAVQPDVKILVRGTFSTLSGQVSNYIGRLNADGSLDITFNANSSVLTLVLQSDGKILVGGYFTTMNEQTRNYIARLNCDGSLDPTFNPGADYAVYALAIQNDGKIVVVALSPFWVGRPPLYRPFKHR